MLSRRVAWIVTITAMFTMTVSYVDRSTLQVLAPTVTKVLHISKAGYGWLAAAFSVAYLIATPVAGWLLDRVGARRGLFVSVLVWSMIAALQAVVPSFAILFAVRIALGLAEGPGFPGAAQTMQRVLPLRDHPRGFGLLFTGSSIGSMITPPIVTWLYREEGWRFAFLGTAIAGLIWVPIWATLTSRPDVRERLDAVPVAHTPGPTFLQLVRHPLMIRALLGVLAAAPVIGLTGAFGSLYLVQRFHLDQGEVGGYLWVPPLLLDVGAFGFGDLAARLARRAGAPPRLLLAIAAAFATSLALLPLAETPWQAMAICAASTGGAGGMYTLITSDLLSRMPVTAVAFASGVLASAQSLALAIAFPLIGWVVDYTGDYVASSITIGLLALPGSVIWILWRPAERYES